jgi:hypothetical protein
MFLNSHYKYIILLGKIKNIGLMGFGNCENLEYVTGLENVEVIGPSAFENTKNLKIHKYNKLKQLFAFAFRNSGALSIDLSDSPFEYIDEYALAFADQLLILNLLNTSLNELPNYLCANDTSLISVYLTKPQKDFNGNFVLDSDGEIIIDNYVPNLTRIGKGTFQNCINLQMIVPQSVKILDEGSFENCIYLTIKLQEGIEEIRKNTFHNCMGLAAINIPKSVKKIEEGAFKTNSPMGMIGVKFNWRDYSDIIPYDPNVWLIGKIIMRVPVDDYSSWYIRVHALELDRKHPKAKKPDPKTSLYITNLYVEKGYGVTQWIYKPFFKEEFEYWKAFGITGATAASIDVGTFISKEILGKCLESYLAKQADVIAHLLETMSDQQENLLSLARAALETDNLLFERAALRQAIDELAGVARQLELEAAQQIGDVVIEEFAVVTVESVASITLSMICLVASVIVTSMAVLDLLFNTYIYVNGSFITEDGLEYLKDGTILDKAEIDKININK